MLAEAETLEDIVIAEGIPGFYDFDGKRVFQPRKKVHPWFERRPMGSFLSQPLTIFCSDIGEIRSFLKTCRYVSDQEQFGVKDHWAPPEVFERTRKGDCDDIALWTWRQLLALGYNARFVVGGSGRYGFGHAWVTVRINDRNYVLEPQLSRYQAFPRLTTLRYQPAVSVGVSHNHVKFFEHSKRTAEPPFRVVALLIPEWLLFWLRTRSLLLLWPYFALVRLYRRKRNKTM